MATGTFTYNALRTKTLKKHIKTRRKIVCHSNSTRAMNDLGSQGIVVSCGGLDTCTLSPVPELSFLPAPYRD